MLMTVLGMCQHLRPKPLQTIGNSVISLSIMFYKYIYYFFGIKYIIIYIYIYILRSANIWIQTFFPDVLDEPVFFWLPNIVMQYCSCTHIDSVV